MKNQHLESLIKDLKKTSIEQEVKIWKRVATDLEGPNKNRRIVNLSKLSRYCKEDDVVIVPGKVLGMGNLDKKITVVAYNFSNGAEDKIKKSGSKSMSIMDFVKKNPKGSKVRVMG